MGRISRQAWQIFKGALHERRQFVWLLSSFGVHRDAVKPGIPEIVLVPECASAGGQCFRQGRFGFVGTFQTRIEGERVKPNIGAAGLADSAPTMRRMVKNEP